MNAAEARGRRSAFMRELAQAETADAAQDVIRAAVGMGASSLDLAEMWAAVKARRLMAKAVYDGTVAEARGEAIEREGGELVPFPGVELPAVMPEGAAEVPGSPGFAWRPPSAGDPGEVFKLRGKAWRGILPWAPGVSAVFETSNDQGEVTARYFEIEARGRSVRASADELSKGEPWLVLAVPGTGARPVREVIANVVLAAAETATPRPALTHTGWHEDADGLFYVFADGRAYPPRDVFLIGAPEKLPAAAAPVAPVELADVAEALVKIATFGGGPALAALGLGVRSLGHSRHKVLGGSVLRGDPNSGKTGAAWHARTLTIARPGRANAFPPLVSATFADTLASIEGVVNFEGDMPSVIDDAALHAKSTRASEAEAAAKIEHVFRPLFNDSQIKGRSTITTLPRAGRYVRSPVIATVQKLPESSQGSIKRRVAIWPVEPGDIDVRWYRGPAEAPGTNAASLVAPLRTLGEHLVIPALAALGADMGAYLMGKDAAALALLTPALARELPGWQDSAEGLAGVVEITAAALAGLLIAAEVVRGEVPADLLTDLAVSYLVGALVAQAAEMSDGASATSPVEAVGEIIRAALLDRRAHVCDDQGAPADVVPGLSPQEQGLARAPGAVGELAGLGAPLYWLPDRGAVGIRSEALHKLITSAADTRITSRTALALPRAMCEAGAALPSESKTSPWVHQTWLGPRGKARLIHLRPELICGASDTDDAPGYPVDPVDPVDPRSGGTNRTQVTVPAVAAESEQVGTNGAPVTGGIGDVLDSASDLRSTGSTGSDPVEPGRTGATPAIVQAEGAAEGATRPAIRGAIPPGPSPRCAVCNGLLDRALAALGETTHPICAPGEQLDADQGDALGGPADAAPSPRPAPVEAPAQARTRAAVRALCLGAEGRAYGPGGEVVEVPPGALDGCGNVGDVAALALALGTRELWVTREAREALGLPASLPDEDRAAREGVSHIFTEGADPAAWDVRPDRPVGLAAWMTVYRVPRSGEGVALVFPEWLDRVGEAPAFGELAPVELARALTLIWQASTYDGNGGRYGGAHYHRSPPAWFRRVMETSVRRSKSGTPGAADLPPIFAAPDKRAPVWIPGAHSAPAEIPPGWVVAKLDVRSCYPSAATGTDFGRGACERIPGGRLDKTPGVHLVRLPADQLAPHASLSPWAPAPRGRREVSAWLDTVAALWLHEARVPFRLAESYVWPEATGRRVFDAPLSRLAEARAQLDGAEGDAAQLAAAVIKAGPNAFLGGWLASDFGGERDAADWTANRAWWLTVKTQAEVRKQRNLLPMIGAGVVILGSERIDTVYCAAPSIEALTSAPGTGRRPAVGPARGKFKVEAVATVGEALAAQLADVKAGPHARLAALAEVLDAPGADGK